MTDLPQVVATPSVEPTPIPALSHPYIVNQFSKKTIDPEIWKTLLTFILWSPTSGGYEPYRVLIIDRATRPDLFKGFATIYSNPRNFLEADKLMLFITLPRSIFTSARWLKQRAMRKMTNVVGLATEAAEVAAEREVNRAISINFGVEETEGDEWAMKQAHIGLAFALSGATMLGIDYVRFDLLHRKAMEAFLMAREVLFEGDRIAVMAGFGYAASKSAVKPSFQAEVITA